MGRVRGIRLIVVLLSAALAALLAACGTDGADDAADPAADEDGQEEAAGADPGEVIELTYAFFAPEGTFPAVQMEEWASRVEERTEGQVQVDTFAGGTLLGADDMYDGVLQGTADIGLGSPGYDVGRFPLMSGIALPVEFPNATVASLTLWDLMEEFEPPEFYDDFKVLTVFTTEPGHLQTTDPVRSLEDMQGMELRATGSGVPVLDALGASGIGMPMPEVPEAVQTGVIQGTMTSREVLQDFNLAEQLKYNTDFPTVVNSFAAVMRRDAYEDLPDDVQQVIDELGPEMAEFTGQYHDEENVQAALEWAQEEHDLEIIQLDDEEAERWQEAIDPLVDEWLDEIGGRGHPAQEWYDRMLELRDEHMETHG